MPIETCPIWGTNFEATGHFFDSTRKFRVDDSPRAGGGYFIAGVLVTSGINSLSGQEKARLTTWLVDQRALGNTQPEITEAVIEHIKAKHPLSVNERADRLLRFIARQTETVGSDFDIRKDNTAAYAWSESTHRVEIAYFIHYLIKKDWLDTTPSVAITGIERYRLPVVVRVTVEGFSHIADRLTNVDSSQAFVAMWFDESVNAAFDNGIEPAIREAGYNALRIDRKPDVDKIDDEVIAEIRRSRFLVADFTHGEKGARGGVYFEAGFAYGLEKPVIYTCHADMVDKLHFDTRQYAHIVWNTPKELREGLKNRILARIGEGPGLHAVL